MNLKIDTGSIGCPPSTNRFGRLVCPLVLTKIFSHIYTLHIERPQFCSKIFAITRLKNSESKGRPLPWLPPKERHTGKTCRHVFVCVCDTSVDTLNSLFHIFHTIVKGSLLEKLPSYGVLAPPHITSHLTTSLTSHITHHSHPHLTSHLTTALTSHITSDITHH